MAAGYFGEADPARILIEYPIGEPFLSGPARLSNDELRALQEWRFAALMRRGWEIPFYQRRWGNAASSPVTLKASMICQSCRASRNRT
jgi:phenylacetate-CoA ligase